MKRALLGPIAALFEWVIAFFALYVAVSIRYAVPLLHVRQLELEVGPMWPRGLVFASVVVVSLLGFGLYSGRQRAQITIVFLRVVAALVIASGAMATIYYLLPSLHLWRGVAALAAIFAGLGIILWRVAARVVGFELLPAGSPMYTPLEIREFSAQEMVVRTLDVLAALALLGLTAPFMLITVIAIKIEDGWRAPALFKQRRVGLDGRIFDAIKFRTMRGSRITRVGTVIRQLRIDELPLLLNVLRGEVSLILKKDRSLRWWTPSAWRDLAIIVGLALLALVLLGIVIGTR
jgi:hypothetical protein